MTTEYKLPAEYHGKLLQQSIIRGAAYLLAAGAVLRWFMVAEPATWYESKQQITVVLFGVVLAGIYTAVLSYQRGKTTTLTMDSEKLSLRSMRGFTEIPFDDIQRIARTKENVLLVYLRYLPQKAVLAITDKLTNFSQLEEQLQQRVRIVYEPQLPRAFNLYFITVQTFLVVVLMLHHFLSHSSTNVISTGFVLLLICAYYLRELWLFRNFRKNKRSITITGILTALVVVRITLQVISLQ